MAVLHNEDDKTRTLLSERCMIGRSRSMDLTIAAPDVSAQHAAIAWSGSCWNIRDLGSRNGTRVKGKVLTPGEPVDLAPGVEICIGESHVFTFVTDAPPSPTATCGDELVEGDGELLALPSSEEPEVLVVYDRGWVARRGEASEAVSEGTVIRAGDRDWTVALPELLSPTTDRSSARRGLVDAKLEFGVSSDEEHVEMTVEFADGSRHAVKPRAHLYVLLTLARQRLAEAEQPESERGWLHTGDLATMLRMTSNQLYVSLHRGRRDLGALGVLEPAALIERRSTARQIRIGVGRLSVRTL